MKKITTILFIVFIGLIFLVPKISLATSGACSSHGGVNCSAGANFDGKVLCNDGWSNSSVYFSDADECKTSCTPPPVIGCTNENDYGVLSAQINRNGGYLGYSASGEGALIQCRNQINSYQSSYQAYTSCLSNLNSNSNSYNSQNNYSSGSIAEKMQQYCVSKYGPQSIDNPTKGMCDCIPGYIFGENGRCIDSLTYNKSNCQKKYGDNSFYNASNNTCDCQGGYVTVDGGKCILADAYCIATYGPNSWLNQSKMKCEWCDQNGVRGKKENGLCVFPAITQLTPTPSPQASTPAPKTPIIQKPISTKINIKAKEKVEDMPATATISPSQTTNPVIPLPPQKQEVKDSWLKSTFTKFLSFFRF